MKDNFTEYMWGIVVFGLVILIIMGAVLLINEIQLKQMIFDCLNNGGFWLTGYSIGCTYPMG